METNTSLDGDNSLCVIFIISKKRKRKFLMKLEIIRIENRIVTCAVDSGGLIDIARRWFTEDIQEGDIIEFEYTPQNH